MTLELCQMIPLREQHGTEWMTDQQVRDLIGPEESQNLRLLRGDSVERVFHELRWA
jgi:hypothetical protein